MGHPRAQDVALTPRGSLGFGSAFNILLLCFPREGESWGASFVENLLQQMPSVLGPQVSRLPVLVDRARQRETQADHRRCVLWQAVLPWSAGHMDRIEARRTGVQETAKRMNG